MIKPTMYFLCKYIEREWWACDGILSNGFLFGGHVCSHPNFAPNDLYFGRNERIEALKAIFGFEWSKEECELVIVNSPAEMPKWYMPMVELQAGLKDTYERYDKLLNGEPQKTEINISLGD